MTSLRQRLLRKGYHNRSTCRHHKESSGKDSQTDKLSYFHFLVEPGPAGAKPKRALGWILRLSIAHLFLREWLTLAPQDRAAYRYRSGTLAFRRKNERTGHSKE